MVATSPTSVRLGWKLEKKGINKNGNKNKNKNKNKNYLTSHKKKNPNRYTISSENMYPIAEATLSANFKCDKSESIRAKVILSKGSLTASKNSSGGRESCPFPGRGGEEEGG